MNRFCVYTIVKGSDVASHGTGPFQRTEVRRWITANDLWLRGNKKQESMAVLLGDASDCSQLRYWGLLTHLSIDDDKGTTTYTLDRIRKFKQTHSPQELELRSSGKQIARNFIRPYAICVTPKFIYTTR